MIPKLLAFGCILILLNCALAAESDPAPATKLHVAWPESLEKSGFEISASGNHNPIGVLLHHTNKAATVDAPESAYALTFCGQSVPFKVSGNSVSLWTDNSLGVRLDRSTNTFSFGVTHIRVELNDCDLQCSLPEFNAKLEKGGGSAATVQLIYAPKISFNYGVGEILFGVDEQGKIQLPQSAAEAGFSSENDTLSLHPRAFQFDPGTFAGTWNLAHTTLKRSGKGECRLLPSLNAEGYQLTAQLGKGKAFSGSFFVGKDFRLSLDGATYVTFIDLPLAQAGTGEPITIRIGPADLDYAKWKAKQTRQREKRAAEKKTIEAELAQAAWQTRFKLRDTILIYSFPEQLIGYPVNFPQHLVRADGLRLLRIGDDSIESVPFQISEAVEKDGFLSSARVSFRTDLPLGASREFCLVFGAAIPAPQAPAVTFQKDNDTGILAANLLKVRVPSVQVHYGAANAPALKDAPAPVLALFREKEWCGKGSLVGNPDLKVLSIDSHLLEAGPLFARYHIAYEFTSNKKYSAVITVQHNDAHMLIDETLEGFVYKDECFLQFSLDPGIHPDHRLVMGQHGYHLFAGNILNGISPSSPFQAASGLRPDGLQPFQIGLFTPGGYGVMRSAALYNATGDSAFLIAVNRLRDWKTETREVWSSRASNIKFYTQDGVTFLRAPLAGTERHWAMALIPRNALETTSILSNPKYHDGAGPEVRLWQRLADFQLDRVKDWVLDWDEKLEAPATPPLARSAPPLQPSAPGRKIPVFVNTFKENPALSDAVAAKIKADARFELVAEKPEDNVTGLVVSPTLVHGSKAAREEARCHFKFCSEHAPQQQWDGAWNAQHQDINQLADSIVKEIDNQGTVVTYESWCAKNGMGGFMLPEIVNYYWDYGAGAAAVSFRDMPHWFAEYARSRSTWTQEQREHVRSVLLFMTYITEDDNCQPHHCMLSGHPNFIMDVMVVLPLACATFPNHPHAKKWRDTFMAYYDEWIRTFQRRDDPEHNALGGRWTENISAYSFQALHSLNLSAEALKVFDGTDLYKNPCLQTWLNWYLEVLMSPNDGVRTHPPEGAHAGSPVTNAGWRPLAEMARDGAQDAPELAAKYHWLETDGKEGANPALHSVLIRDHGPVLRYDFGGPHEAYLHLMQIAGPYNYRWGEGSDVLYYGSKNKIWAYNLTDDAGDFWRWDTLSAFTVQVAATPKGDDRDDLHSQIGKPRTQGLGRHSTDQPLYDFGFAQFYRAQAEKPDAVYRSMGMMLLRDDYIILHNDVTDPETPGQFVWANTGALPNIQQLKPGAPATDETIEEDAKHHARTLQVRRYKGKGDFLTLVSAAPLKAEATPFGALVAQNEYVFSSIALVNYNENDVTFSGTAGYVRPNQLALFEGTRIGWKGWRLDRDGGDFGISAEIDGNKITGRIAGRKGGKVTLSLPDGISGKNAKVVVNDRLVTATTDEKTVVFDAPIAPRDGYKSYSIMLGHE